MKRVFQRWIRFYQKYLSPLHGPRCRFYPTCSRYAWEALEEWGLLIGTGLTVWRLLRCQPFGKGGIDPVPKKAKAKNSTNE